MPTRLTGLLIMLLALSCRTPDTKPPSTALPQTPEEFPSPAYGEYDWKLSTAIQQRWYDSLKNTGPLPKGKVTIRFKLHRIGGITDIRTVKSTVDELFTAKCHEAVAIPNVEAWSESMRKEIGQDYRTVTVSFHY